MEDSKNILDFYIQNNKNKYKIKKENSERDISIAEHTILSCINALGMYSELYDDVDIDKVIKMLIAKDFNDFDVKNLKKGSELLELKNEYKNINTKESFLANQASGMTNLRISTNSSARPEVKKLFDNYMKLQKTIRQGHIYWGVKTNRKESILEHIYGTLLLCIGMQSEYNYYVDFNKVLKMLLLHETEEIVIGDKTAWDISKEEKEQRGKIAVDEVLKGLKKYNEYKSLIDEFNDCRTIESNYAYLCDKLEYDLQVKMYQNMGCYDMNNIPSNVVTTSEDVKEIMDNGANNVFDIHYEYDKYKYTNYPAVRKILELSKRY